MRTALLLVATGAVLITGVALARTFRYGTAQLPVEPVAVVAIPEGAAQRLAESIRLPTISHEDPAAFDAVAFREFHAFLEASFPRVHARLRRETIGTHSLLFTWAGSDTTLEPILLTAHMDVAPVEPGTVAAWQEPPFSGRIAQGYVWGRGSIDNKSAVMGTLEAVELLLSQGFRPERTVLLAYGHDEEVGGLQGAREIAARLRSRNVRLEMVLDEGGVISEGILPGVSQPVALVGVAEKGFLTVELSTRSKGGHSSLPPRQSAIGVVSEAVTRVENHPMPARLEGATSQLFERISPHLPFAQRLAFANLWVSRAMVLRTLKHDPSTNAMIRTTAAVTIFDAGTKDNILPGYARAVVNFRILPGDSIAGVLQHVRDVIDEPRIDVTQVGAFSAEPSSVSSSESQSFRILERTIRSLSPDAIVAPYLVVVVTDARHYSDLTSNVYRFLPLNLTSSDLSRMHGTDERIGIDQYANAIRFYRQLLVNATRP